MQELTQEKKVDIKPLKQFVLDKLPRSSHLREIILVEETNLSVSEFLSKMQFWISLFDLENKRWKNVE